jgi:hypothetical protein
VTIESFRTTVSDDVTHIRDIISTSANNVEVPTDSFLILNKLSSIPAGVILSQIKCLIILIQTPTDLISSFMSLTSLESLTILETSAASLQTNIQNLAKNVRMLKYLTVPTWGGTSIASNAFNPTAAMNWETSIEHIFGFEDVTSIGSNAFNSCRALKSIPPFTKVTSIGDAGFCFCSALTSINFPNLVSLGGGDGGFGGCTSLTSVSLPKLQSIGGSGFNGCSSLTTVYFPMLKSLSSHSFAYCGGLKDVTFSDTMTSAYNAFPGANIATLRLVGQNPSGNGIAATCLLLKNGGIGTNITNFYFSLGEAVQELSNVSAYKALYEYIVGVLNVSIADFGLFKSGATCHGYLVLEPRFTTTLTPISGKLIDVISKSGKDMIVSS